MSEPSSLPGTLGQPSEQDVVMNPPSMDDPASSTSQDSGEGNKTLKRRFDEVEQDTASETARPEVDAQRREEAERSLSGVKEVEQRSFSSSDAPSQVLNTTGGGSIRIVSLPMQHGSGENGQQSSSGNLPSDSASGSGVASANMASGHKPASKSSTSPKRQKRQAQDSQSLAPVTAEQEVQHARTSDTSEGSLNLLNGNSHDLNDSQGPSGAKLRPQTRKGGVHASRNTQETPAKRETRSTRQTRSSRNDSGNVIAAVAAATVEVEAAAAANAGSSTDPSTQTTTTSSSSLAHALGPHNHTSLSPSTNSTSLAASAQLHMDSILKVAEAAVAAQRAAAAAAGEGTKPNETVDPNLDPSLFAASTSTGQNSSQGVASNESSSTTKTVNAESTNATSANTSNAVGSSSSTPPSTSTSTPTPTTPSPSTNLSSNPYYALGAHLLPRTNGSSPNPTAHPMLMPYPFFYPPPAAVPGAPNNTPYPIPYNPYYYLAAHMIPAANGMYPPPPGNFSPPAQQQRLPPEPPKPKAKRLKAHTVTTKSFSIPMVPRDKKGKPMLPLNVGIMTVISLGEVCMRDHFHTERYIFPVGYEVTRRYLSTVDPTIEVVYHCTILDGGDGPKFQIIPSDKPDKPIIAGTATGAWSNIVKQANAIRNRQHSNSVSGPDFFGLGQNTIKHLIQELPNADRLRDYVWQNFVEGGPLGGRHAAVIPALPEEYDASLPIGAYYPKRDIPVNPNVPRGLAHYPQHIIAQAEAQKAQKLAARASPQEQPVAGPSNPPSTTTPQLAPHVQPHQPLPPQPSLGMTGVVNGNLNVHEYHPQAVQQAQPTDHAPTQGGVVQVAGNSVVGAPGSASPASSQHSRPASQGNQHQEQQQPQMTMPVNGVMPTLGADGMMPTTFAGIMSAYPIPGTSSPHDAAAAGS